MKILGLDIGNVIKVNKEDMLIDGVIDAINDLKERFDKIYIISRVDDKYGAKRNLNFLIKNNIVPTLINQDDIFFCLERSDKGRIAKLLNITHFIDDRTECLHYMHTVPYRFALNPSEDQLIDFPPNLIPPIIVTKNWEEIRIKIILTTN